MRWQSASFYWASMLFRAVAAACLGVLVVIMLPFVLIWIISFSVLKKWQK